MPLSLDEIARLSGVSRSIVARVMNGDMKVKAETRQHVLEIVEQNDRQGSPVGHAASRVLGLVIPTGVAALFSDPYFPQIIQSVSAASNAQEYSVMLWLAEPEYERRMLTEVLNNGLLDGVIVSSMMMNDPIVQILHDSKVPFVLIGRHPKLDDVNYLDADNFAGARKATLHLLQLGRSRVATITGPLNVIPGYDRYRGYEAALEEQSIPLRPELVAEGDFSEASGYMGMLQLLRAKPDAVFVSSDVMAVGALRALRVANLRVPQDVAIVGYDDIPQASRSEPPLTTVRQPIQKMGRMAVELLIEILRHHPSAPQHILVETELVVRKSCGMLNE